MSGACDDDRWHARLAGDLALPGSVADPPRAHRRRRSSSLISSVLVTGSVRPGPRRSTAYRRSSSGAFVGARSRSSTRWSTRRRSSSAGLAVGLGVQGRPVQHRRPGPVPHGRRRGRRRRGAAPSHAPGHRGDPVWRSGRHARRCRLGLHPGLPQGVHRRPRSRDHDHAQLTSRSRSLAWACHGPLRARRLRSPHPRRRQRLAARILLGRERAISASSRAAHGAVADRLAPLPDARSASRSGPSGRTRMRPATRACARGLLIILTMTLSGPARRAWPARPRSSGVTHYMTASYGTTVGFDAIAVALLGRSQPARDRAGGRAARRACAPAPA